MKTKRTLRGIRNDLGMTQKEMADKIGCSQAMYQRYERNEVIIPVNLLIKMADMVGIVDVREIAL